ncbi:MAG: GNAT family N-acetyltransferase [Bacteroidetes bacterium]|nr:MAG: GNAT family N-acetyltransferase [Bacteroidota bacterium]
MHIEPVLWDSDFFGYPIGKLMLKQDEVIDVEVCSKSAYKLIYIFSESALTAKQKNGVNADLVDCKVDLEAFSKVESIGSDDHIVPIQELNPKLLDLVYQSGHYSRFKLDKQFTNGEFEQLYLEWINKALNDKEQQVMGFMEGDKLVGFITLGNKSSTANIGLIAVDEMYRGKSIGKHLIKDAHRFAQQNKLDKITVTTQWVNNGAMQFYLQQGFEVVKKLYIYHLWK